MDFDGDGRADLLTGSWPGDVYLFRRQADGSFAPGEILKDKDSNPIRARSDKDRKGADNASAAFAADWNGDGVLDLIVGNIDGGVYVVLNEGTAQKPAFGRPVPLEAGGKPIKVPHGDAGPLVADWDGDGKPDLIVGAGDGSVQWFRNTGTAKAPVLAGAVALVKGEEQGPRVEGDDDKPADKADKKPDPPPAARPGTRAKVCVADWNGDGRPDLIVGDFSYGPAEPKVLTDAQKAERDRAREEWQAAVREFMELQPAGPDDEDAAAGAAKKADRKADKDSPAAADRAARLKKVEARLEELGRKRAEFEDRPVYHGWVWVYLRQPEPAKTAGAGGP